MELRPYQAEDIARIRAGLFEHKQVVYQLPTGGGKTFVFIQLVKASVSKGKRVFILVHVNELVTQIQKELRKHGVAAGIIAAGEPYISRLQVYVCSVQTLVRRLDKYQAPDIVIVDECHHSVADTYLRILNHYNTYTLGVTATPQRLDGSGLDKYYKHLITGPTVTHLIENNWLAPFDIIAPDPGVDFNAARMTGGDYNMKDAAQLMEKSAIMGNAVKVYNQFAKGIQFCAFLPTIEKSVEYANVFNQAGISCAHIDGQMPKVKRKYLVDKYKAGDLMGLFNCNIITEGFDLPEMGAVLQMRPTQSIAMYLQMVGRGLRYKPGKRCIIIDMVENWRRHGAPDAPREWSLEGRKGGAKKAANEIGLKNCTACLMVYNSALKGCPHCGATPEVKKREIEVREAVELVKLTAQALTAAERKKKVSKAQKKAKTIDDLYAIANQYGYDPKWAEHVWRHKQKAAERWKANDKGFLI